VAPAFCGSLVLAGFIVGWLAGFGSAAPRTPTQCPDRDRAAALAANRRGSPMNRRQSQWATRVRYVSRSVGSAEVATAAEPAAGTATDTTAASDRPEMIVVAACPIRSQTLSAIYTCAEIGGPGHRMPRNWRNNVQVIRRCLNSGPQDFRYLILVMLV